MISFRLFLSITSYLKILLMNKKEKIHCFNLILKQSIYTGMYDADDKKSNNSN